MDPSSQEDVHPSEKGTEPNADPLGWSSDELDFSSDIDMDAVHVEEGGVKYAVEDSLHVNCIEKQQYEKEKQQWEDAMEGLSQRFSRSQAMLENMKEIAFRADKKIEQLENEKKEMAKYKEMNEVLEKQIADLNMMLDEANQETARCRIRCEEMEEKTVALEEKLYGPVNYYYQEYLRVSKEYEALQGDKDATDDQLRQVKEIMRGLIVEQSKRPTMESVQKERESFAKQVAAYEKRIEVLEEENRKLRSQDSSRLCCNKHDTLDYFLQRGITAGTEPLLDIGLGGEILATGTPQRRLHRSQRPIELRRVVLRAIIEPRVLLSEILLPAVRRVVLEVLLRQRPRRQPLLHVEVIHARVGHHARLPPLRQLQLLLRLHVAHEHRLHEPLAVAAIPGVHQSLHVGVSAQHEVVVLETGETGHVLAGGLAVVAVDVAAALFAAHAAALDAVAAIGRSQRAETDLALAADCSLQNRI